MYFGGNKMKHTNMKYNESYVVKNLADEIVLVHQDEYNVDCSKIITLNEVALFIIDRIKEGLNDDQIIDALLNEYDVDKTTATNDVETFINKLIELGIVNE